MCFGVDMNRHLTNTIFETNYGLVKFTKPVQQASLVFTSELGLMFVLDGALEASEFNSSAFQNGPIILPLIDNKH